MVFFGFANPPLPVWRFRNIATGRHRRKRIAPSTRRREEEASALEMTKTNKLKQLVFSCLSLLFAIFPGVARPADPAGKEEMIDIAPPGRPPLRLHVEESGAGPPLLLLHGLGGAAFTWRHVVPALAKTHRVIALDLKGFGQSEKPLDGAYSAEDQAALVAAFIRKADLRGLALAGHSFGGTVALFAALSFEGEPGRIARLAVLDAPALPQDFPGLSGVLDAPLLVYDLIGAMAPETLARKMLTLARAPKNPPPEDDVTGYAAPFRSSAARRTFVETARSILTANARGYAEKFKALSPPTLVVWCRGDEIAPLSTGRKLARTLPRARLEILGGCNHFPQDERPEALLAVLSRFLRGPR